MSAARAVRRKSCAIENLSTQGLQNGRFALAGALAVAFLLTLSVPALASAAGALPAAPHAAPPLLRQPIDWVPRDQPSPERSTFWMLHSAYVGLLHGGFEGRKINLAHGALVYDRVGVMTVKL